MFVTQERVSGNLFRGVGFFAFMNCTQGKILGWSTVMQSIVTPGHGTGAI